MKNYSQQLNLIESDCILNNGTKSTTKRDNEALRESTKFLSPHRKASARLFQSFKQVTSVRKKAQSLNVSMAESTTEMTGISTYTLSPSMTRKSNSLQMLFSSESPLLEEIP